VVPVWKGAAFVGETLESVLVQRDVTFKLIVSVDGADDASAEACRPFVRDARVKLIIQPRRLGWVGNSAALIAEAIAAGVDYACIQPHDDLIAEDYLATLLDAAHAAPEAAVVYSDIQSFGAATDLIRQTSVVGSPLARQTTLLLDHFNAVAFRGLTRAEAFRRVRAISGNGVEDFAADTVWMTRLATVGDLVRVPQALYRKRYHPGNTHGAWQQWALERRVEAWTVHCLDMLREAVSVAADRNARQMLARAARLRYSQFAGGSSTYARDIAALTPSARQAALRNFRKSTKAILKNTAAS
jgi:GT2 family glycosyltransferase